MIIGSAGGSLRIRKSMEERYLKITRKELMEKVIKQKGMTLS